MERRLYRSRTERMVAGVAGGLGEYLHIDPVIVRLFFIVLTLATGWGVLLYIILWALMPVAPQESVLGAEGIFVESRYRRLDVRERNLLIGGTLVALGLVLLGREFGLFWWLHARYLWPLLLIAGGIALLVGRTRS